MNKSFGIYNGSTFNIASPSSSMFNYSSSVKTVSPTNSKSEFCCGISMDGGCWIRVGSIGILTSYWVSLIP